MDQNPGDRKQDFSLSDSFGIQSPDSVSSINSLTVIAIGGKNEVSWRGAVEV